MKKIINGLMSNLRKYLVLGTSLKNEAQPDKTDRVLTCDWRTTERNKYMLTENFFHKTITEQIMTYIVAGKLNDNTFLMVDCVETKENDEYSFCNKLTRLKSTEIETYSTITGYDAFEYAIKIFDTKCFDNNIILNIENEEHINEILEIYELLKINNSYTNGINIEKNFDFACLIFINKDKVCQYYIKLNENGKMYINKNTLVGNNQLFEGLPMLIDINNKNLNNSGEIIEYCKNKIIRFYKGQEKTENLDLKDKFSFIMFEGDKTTKLLPYKNNQELLFSEIGCDYSKI